MIPNKRAKMEDKVIEYKSAQKAINVRTNVLETSDQNGIVCEWSGNLDYDSGSESSDSDDGGYNANFTWKLDCSKLKNEGVDRLSGFITLKPSPRAANFNEQKINIDSEEGQITVTRKLFVSTSNINASFEYHLTPQYIEKVSYDEMFAASDKTDAILVIEEKKAHVSKVFLSIHSDFFTALFSSNFKEGELTEIPIKDVSYEDFGLLMSIIYPKQVFPNDNTAAKLLELADRFLMPFITRQVEHHLLEHSKLGNEKLMWLADAYSMPELLEKTICAMNTVAKIKALEKTEEYGKLSAETVAKLFKRLVGMV